MKIAIDISPLGSEGHFLQHKVRGTGVYTNALKDSLVNYFPENSYTFFSNRNEIPKDCEIVHIPYFELFFLTLPFSNNYPTVVTIHDVTPLVFSENFPRGLKGKFKWQIQKFLLNNVKAIITDSRASKRDIVRFTGINESKIHVVYLAALDAFKKKPSTQLLEKVKKKYNLSDKFGLYVGDATWNKNLPRLLQAVVHTKIPFVIVGKVFTEKNVDAKNLWNSDLIEAQQLIQNSKDIHALGFLTIEELVALYTLAQVFVMPSLYEGFGLPILEAMSCLCPVITAKQGSIEEVAGNAVMYVDAYSIKGIAAGIKEVFSNEKLRSELISKGLQQTKKFTWEKTAKDTLQVYKNVIEKR